MCHTISRVAPRCGEDTAGATTRWLRVASSGPARMKGRSSGDTDVLDAGRSNEFRQPMAFVGISPIDPADRQRPIRPHRGEAVRGRGELETTETQGCTGTQGKTFCFGFPCLRVRPCARGESVLPSRRQRSLSDHRQGYARGAVSQTRPRSSAARQGHPQSTQIRTDSKTHEVLCV